MAKSEHINRIEDGTTRRSAKLSQGAALLKVAARKVSAEQRRGSKQTRALSCEPKVQRLLRSAPIASRRTEGIAIATQSVNRVRCPLKPWGPAGGNGRGPRRKYFRWGNLGGTRRRGLNLTPMSGDGSPFQTRGRKARMGLPAKCMHFVGSPGWRGKSR